MEFILEEIWRDAVVMTKGGKLTWKQILPVERCLRKNNAPRSTINAFADLFESNNPDFCRSRFLFSVLG